MKSSKAAVNLNDLITFHRAEFHLSHTDLLCKNVKT